MLKKYINGQATIHCSMCDKPFTRALGANEEFKWDNQFNTGYLPIVAQCPNCEVDGKITTVHLNPNIPEGDFDEFEMEAIGLIPQDELNARKYMRDIMWERRPDLKTQSRTLRNANGANTVSVVLDKYKKTDMILRGPYAHLHNK